MTRQEQEEAEQAAYEEHMQALYDEQNWMQQGENDVLRAKLEATQRERDAYHEAWAQAQARLDCGADATEAVREERAAVVAYLRDVARRDWSATTAYTMMRAIEAIEHGAHRDRRKE
jgi:hypothetical protein